MRRLTFVQRKIDATTLLVDPQNGEEFYITDMEVAQFYLGKQESVASKDDTAEDDTTP